MEQLRVFWFVKHRTKKVHAHVIVALEQATCTVLLYERYSWARTHAPANYRGCRTNCGIARVERGLQLRQRPPILYCQCAYTYAPSPTHMGS